MAENKLKITRPDNTIHIVPVIGLGNQLRMNAYRPDHQKYRIEEINDKGETIKVHAESGQVKAVVEQNAKLAEKDAEIENLKKLLAEKADKDSAGKAAKEKKADKDSAGKAAKENNG